MHGALRPPSRRGTQALQQPLRFEVAVGGPCAQRLDVAHAVTLAKRREERGIGHVPAGALLDYRPVLEREEVLAEIADTCLLPVENADKAEIVDQNVVAKEAVVEKADHDAFGIGFEFDDCPQSA